MSILNFVCAGDSDRLTDIEYFHPAPKFRDLNLYDMNCGLEQGRFRQGPVCKISYG